MMSKRLELFSGWSASLILFPELVFIRNKKNLSSYLQKSYICIYVRTGPLIVFSKETECAYHKIQRD